MHVLLLKNKEAISELEGEPCWAHDCQLWFPVSQVLGGVWREVGEVRAWTQCPVLPVSKIRRWGFHPLAALHPHYSIANFKIYKLDLVLSLHYVSIPRGRD